MIKAVYTGSEFLESVVPGEEVGLILETTSFYAEQGGQVNISVNLLCISSHRLVPFTFHLQSAS